MGNFILERPIQKAVLYGKETSYVNLGNVTVHLNINADVLPHFLQNVELEIDVNRVVLKPGSKNVFVVEHVFDNNSLCNITDILTHHYKVVRFKAVNSQQNSVGTIIEVSPDIDYVVIGKITKFPYKEIPNKGVIYRIEKTYLYINKDEATEVDFLTFMKLIKHNGKKKMLLL